MSVGSLKEPTLLALRQLLSPRGYRKSSSLFSKQSQDVVHLIEVQGSLKSTATTPMFTVNIGVFAPELIYADVRSTTKPSIPQAHWRTRLGILSPERQDLWWSVTSDLQARSAAQDISARVEHFALPVLERLQNLGSLVALWESGSSPGISEAQRKEFLLRWRHERGFNPSAA